MVEELTTMYKAKQPSIFETEEALLRISRKLNWTQNFDKKFFLDLGKFLNDDIEEFLTASPNLISESAQIRFGENNILFVNKSQVYSSKKIINCVWMAIAISVAFEMKFAESFQNSAIFIGKISNCSWSNKYNLPKIISKKLENLEIFLN